MPAIQFILDHLSNSTTMDLSGAFTKYAPTLDCSATAVLEIDVDTMKSVFQFESDSYEFSDLSNADINYYVFSSHWPSGFDSSYSYSASNFNPANAMLDYTSAVGGINSTGAIAATQVSGDPIPSNKMMVAHDFVRYLAEKLFSTHMGVDLFNNQVTLLQHLRVLCAGGTADASGTWQDVVTKVREVSVTGTHPTLQTDASGNKYMSNSDTTIDNLSRVLATQMMEYDPDRFHTIEATGLPQPLPFKAGDSISFKLTIHPAPGQNNLTGVAAFGGRSYLITLNLVDSASNTVVDSLELGPQDS